LSAANVNVLINRIVRKSITSFFMC
jgi:hypothetical protein